VKIRTHEYSENAVSSAFSLTTTAWYFAQIIGVGLIGLKGAQWLNCNGSQTIAVIMVVVVGYLAYATAKMAMVDVSTAEAIAQEAQEKANAIEEQANEGVRYYEQLQSLRPIVRTLAEKAQTLESEKRSLETDLQTHLTNNAELSRSLESEKANAKKKLEGYQSVALETAQDTLLAHNKALQIAKNDGLQWKAKYEVLRGEVDRATAEKELQSLERSLTTRKSAMTGRNWSAEITAKHEAEEARVAELKTMLA